jgi:acyl-CoA synthetase (AMP-forming)/AMP-acid ligase II
MNAPFTSNGFSSLRAMLAPRGAGAAGPLVSDDSAAIAVGVLAAAAPPAELAGKSVLLALPRQIEALAALVALDGVARRIVLWPQDQPPEQLDSILGAAAVDHVITAWPLPQGGAPAAAGVAGAGRASEWVLFTSGTTRQPKMVLHTLASLSGHLWAAAGGAGGATWATFYDIRRYGGLQVALRALFGGASLVLGACAAESPAAFLARAGRAGVTHILGTPSHWRRALMSDAAGAMGPRYVRLSGEVADQMILDRLRAAYPAARLVHAFASTEAGLAFEVDDGLAGFPAALIGAGGAATLRVVDGALQVRSPRAARGYLRHGVDAIAAADGFVDTGDMVELRGNRYYFAGRRDGTINVGGQKVHPEEIEAVINQHPDVQMSLVSSRVNPITGAVVVARIVPRGANAATGALEADVRLFCRQHLPPHKVPAIVKLVPALDVSPSGKLVRPGA